MSESDPTGLEAGEPGAKLDAGKSVIYAGLIDQFKPSVTRVGDTLNINIYADSFPLPPAYVTDAETDIQVLKFLRRYPLTSLGVAQLTAIGAAKYSWGGWATVENGIERYTEAYGRHAMKCYVEFLDDDTNVPHAVACAWNALAVLSLSAGQGAATEELIKWTQEAVNACELNLEAQRDAEVS